MGLQRGPSIGGAAYRALGLALCVAVAAGWAVQRLAASPDAGQPMGPDWLPLAAAAVAAAGFAAPDGAAPWRRLRGALLVVALLLMVWAANGLPFDLLTMAGLMGRKTASGEIVIATVYWPGLVTRVFALGAVVLLARLTLAGPAAEGRGGEASWYGYLAFVLALPYPALRIHWALGGTLGLSWPGAAGQGWEPLLIAIPWALAAVLSLLLVSPRSWMPRRLLLLAGWSATAIVATIGPAAIWAFASTVASGGDAGNGGIAIWVFGLFYTSWFLWAIAGGAATRSYQRRTAGWAAPQAVH